MVGKRALGVRLKMQSNIKRSTRLAEATGSTRYIPKPFLSFFLC